MHALPRGDGLDAARSWSASGRRQGRLEDLDILLEVADTMGIMPGTTICGLADGAAWPVKNAIRKFRAEFEDYIRTHQDPSYEVTGLQEAIALGVTPERSNNTSLPILPGPGLAPRSIQPA